MEPPTSNKRTAAIPFRMTTGIGAAAAASRPPSRGFSVWVSPSYRGQVSPAYVSDEAVGSDHIGLLTIAGSTDDVYEERTCISDLDDVWSRGTSPRPQSLSAAYCLGGRNGTRTHKEQKVNRERWVQEKSETLLTRISNGEQVL